MGKKKDIDSVRKTYDKLGFQVVLFMANNNFFLSRTRDIINVL